MPPMLFTPWVGPVSRVAFCRVGCRVGLRFSWGDCALGEPCVCRPLCPLYSSVCTGGGRPFRDPLLAESPPNGEPRVGFRISIWGRPMFTSGMVRAAGRWPSRPEPGLGFLALPGLLCSSYPRDRNLCSGGALVRLAGGSWPYACGGEGCTC